MIKTMICDRCGKEYEPYGYRIMIHADLCRLCNESLGVWLRKVKDHGEKKLHRATQKQFEKFMQFLRAIIGDKYNDRILSLAGGAFARAFDKSVEVRLDIGIRVGHPLALEAMFNELDPDADDILVDLLLSMKPNWFSRMYRIGDKLSKVLLDAQTEARKEKP